MFSLSLSLSLKSINLKKKKVNRLNKVVRRIRETKPCALPSSQARGSRGMTETSNKFGGCTSKEQPGRIQEGTSLTEHLHAQHGLGVGKERWAS